MKTHFSIKFDSLVKEKCNEINKPIFVLVGLSEYIDLSLYCNNIVDTETFDQEGNGNIFSPEWFTRVFIRLSKDEDFYIFSHQQYSYLTEYLNPDLYKDRLVVVYDNLRSLLPIPKELYMEKSSDDGLEIRPEEMPVYHAEQFKIGDNYYYSVKAFDEDYASIPFFTETKELDPSPYSYSSEEVIDIASNPYSLDYFVNECIRTANFNKRMIVKLSAKNILSSSIEKKMKYVNALLYAYGGGIYTKTLENVIRDYKPSEESTDLLKKYWGETASYRNINVYENPEIGNTTTPISQGLIVDTIISEYKSAKNGEIPRDIFITAPTGAGKSLIFQIPAFYAAENGDVTIVVSPLKALMNDQVMNLKNERKYSRVEFINSDLNLMDRDRIIDRCKKGEIDVLYLSPELLLSYSLSYFIGERRLGLLIIDEAHLITTWGRDFRVDYWFLGNHLNKIRKYAESSFPLLH
jgi:ATP-dependent DNA helicase RecQ